jgi:acetyltransferase-like isoleucine patch superfamily enzyme
MEGARVGCDCNIGGHAFIEKGAVLGDRVTVKNGVMVWEGVEVGDDVFLGPGMLFTNDLRPRSPRMADPGVAARYSAKERWLVGTRVRRGATIGAGAVVVCGVEVGEFALVAAGSVVREDVAPHALVAGNPAIWKGWVCRCAGKLVEGGGGWVCSACGRRHERAGGAMRAVGGDV